MYPRLELAEVVRSGQLPQAEPVHLEPDPITTQLVLGAITGKRAMKPAVAATLVRLERELVTALRARGDVLREGKRRLQAVDQATAEQRAKVQKDVDAQIAAAESRYRKLRDGLVTKLDANLQLLTGDGALVRATLLRDRAYERYDDALDAYLVTPSGSEPVPDHRETLAAAELVLARDPDELAAFARYFQADALAATKQPDATRRFLDLVKQFPSSPVTEPSYQRIAAGSLAEESRADGLVANRWLATNASTAERRNAARYRLGKLLDADRDRAAARAAYCLIVDDADPLAEAAGARIARGFVDSDLEPLRAACPAKRCPCSERVLAPLVADLILIEDDARAREVSALAPTPIAVPDQRAAESPADYAQHSRALQRCFDDMLERGRWTAAALRLELTVGAGGVVERAHTTGSTFDPETVACLERTARRHRFTGVERKRLVLPIRFAPP